MQNFLSPKQVSIYRYAELNIEPDKNADKVSINLLNLDYMIDNFVDRRSFQIGIDSQLEKMLHYVENTSFEE